MEQLDLLKSTIESKEYKELMKCASKNCDKFKAVLDKEVIVIHKILEIQESIASQKDFKMVIQKTKEMIILNKELANLNSKKEPLVCALDKCADEFINLQVHKNKIMIKVLEKTEKKFSNIEKNYKKKGGKVTEPQTPSKMIPVFGEPSTPPPLQQNTLQNSLVNSPVVGVNLFNVSPGTPESPQYFGRTDSAMESHLLSPNKGGKKYKKK